MPSASTSMKDDNPEWKVLHSVVSESWSALSMFTCSFGQMAMPLGSNGCVHTDTRWRLVNSRRSYDGVKLLAL